MGWSGGTDDGKLALSTNFLTDLISYGSLRSLRALDGLGEGNVLIMSLFPAGVPKGQI